MKKDVIRREFLKLKLNGYSYKECQIEIEKLCNKRYSTRVLKYWKRRFEEGDWDLKDISQRPFKLNYKFPDYEKKLTLDYRKQESYSAKQLRVKLIEKNVFMSESTIRRLIKNSGLSRGNKMEGIKLKWVRFERDTPNSMWQIDGTQRDDGLWEVPIEDDCSRYCLAIGLFEHNNTENTIKLIEAAIEMHGKPREILTDNGPEFGGNGKGDNEFDAWCDKQGIIHIRSKIHKPTTVGKISALQQTMQRELPWCNNDYEHFRWRYNTERPHQSLNLLTPAQVYFGFKRHKKFYVYENLNRIIRESLK